MPEKPGIGHLAYTGIRAKPLFKFLVHGVYLNFLRRVLILCSGKKANTYDCQRSRLRNGN